MEPDVSCAARAYIDQEAAVLRDFLAEMGVSHRFLTAPVVQSTVKVVLISLLEGIDRSDPALSAKMLARHAAWLALMASD